MDDYQIEARFPAVITSTHQFDYHEFQASLQYHQKDIHQLLLKYGALLFRGFPINSAIDFASMIENLGLGNFVNYIGGDSPRDKVEKQVYTSTEAPPALHIPLHQELSFIKYHPRHIYFYCDLAPSSGGETIIGNARSIYHDLNASVRQRFIEKQLTYISRYYYQSKTMQWINRFQRSHKSWTEVFETNNKYEVEKRCVENEFAWKWLKDDWIEIRQTRPAILTHPHTQEPIWFNQAHLYDFNVRLLGWKNYLGAKLLYCRRWTLLHEVIFADGSFVPKKDLYHIMDVLQNNTVAYPWQTGDVLVLDNMLTMHGRAPFQGSRRVLTALTS